MRLNEAQKKAIEEAIEKADRSCSCCGPTEIKDAVEAVVRAIEENHDKSLV